MSKNDLAIIIPAYKGRFLKETLISLTQQTNQNFHVYIGDDHSPEGLYDIIKPFRDKLQLTYHRFSENQGQINLSLHWHRSIEMSKNEPWIWLFSDDDLMESNCVEAFFQTLTKHPDNSLFRFSQSIINAESNVLKHCNIPAWQTSSKLLRDRLLYRRSLFVVDGIFSRAIYQTHGFIDFPAAWCTDDATWIRYGEQQGIIGMVNKVDGKIPRVYWRYSGDNISSNRMSTEVVNQKKEAVVAYKNWLKEMKKEGLIEFNPLFLSFWAFWMKHHILGQVKL